MFTQASIAIIEALKNKKYIHVACIGFLVLPPSLSINALPIMEASRHSMTTLLVTICFLFLIPFFVFVRIIARFFLRPPGASAASATNSPARQHQVSVFSSSRNASLMTPQAGDVEMPSTPNALQPPAALDPREFLVVSRYNHDDSVPLPPPNKDNSAIQATPGTSIADDVCHICFEQYDEGDFIARSQNPSCPHNFHESCLCRWLSSAPTQQLVCPVCRQSYHCRDDSSTVGA